MSGLVAAAAVAALVVALVKWLRVVQREHYLGGSLLTMTRTWMRSAWWNRLLGLGPAVAAVAALAGLPIVPMTAIAAMAVALFPLGLSVRGRTSPLAWTGRLRRLAVLAAVAIAAGVVAGRAIERAVEAEGRVTPNVFALALFPLALEGAVAVAVPIERWLSQRFVTQATATLARVGPTVVGITGSFGKTSTKAYVEQLVEGTRRVVASPASFNNRLGLARAVNEHLTNDAEVFVAEMGTYGPGEIAQLCRWVPPDVAVITAIGPVHLERFGTEERILRAKSEILATAAAAVFNVDHPALAALADETEGKRVWRCGTGEQASDVRVVVREGTARLHVGERVIGETDGADVFAANLACAVAVALQLGVDEADVVERLRRLRSPAHRQTVAVGAGGFTIIDDTVNANPAGAARALGVLAEHGSDGARRVVVTPGMVELGPRQAAENEAFARHAAEVADDVVLVGRTNLASLRAGTAGGSASVIVVGTRQEAVEWVRTHLAAGDVVLYENDLPDHYP